MKKLSAKIISTFEDYKIVQCVDWLLGFNAQAAIFQLYSGECETCSEKQPINYNVHFYMHNPLLFLVIFLKSMKEE